MRRLLSLIGVTGRCEVASHCRHATTGTLTKDHQENYNSLSFAAVLMFWLSL
jgi:hypothetical protein